MVIGIGAGNPDHMTLQAVKALNRAAVVFIPDKGSGKEELAQLRRDICERHVEGDARYVTFDVPEREKPASGYRESIEAWRAKVEKVYEQLLRNDLQDDEWGAFLVWGDPSLYDGTIRILRSIEAGGLIEIDFEVVPGITSIQALAASHKVALNRIGEPVTITTARRLAQGVSSDAGNVVVMLDGDAAFKSVDGDYDIHWGAYLGTPEEILFSGRLRDVAAKIEHAKREARARHGWIMDTYMLTRRDSSEGD